MVLWHAHRGKTKSQDIDGDAESIQARAEQGDIGAEYKLGNMYGAGSGVPKDYVLALRWYRAAAEKGDSKSEYGVGYLYDAGKGVPQDFSEALRWYQRAADQNNPRAQCAIAAMFYDGRGVKRDWTEAAHWYRRSAENGFSRAQYDLGYMYYYGQGLTQDRVEATRWFREALEQNDDKARQALSYKLTTLRIVSLVFQTLFGSVLAFSPFSFNIWEPNEVPRDVRSWLSLCIGWAVLVDAGMGWWGYTHYLLWSWTYGTTAFILSKIVLNIAICVLLPIFVLRRNLPAKSLPQEVPPE